MIPPTYCLTFTGIQKNSLNDNISLKRRAIHEASHAVVAKLFEENIHLQHLTISDDKIKEVDKSGAQTYGMIGVVPNGDPWISAGVVSLAGMVGEKIWTDGPASVQENKAKILANPNELDQLLGGGDFDLFHKDSSVNAHKYGSAAKYEQLCLEFLLDFLCDEQVWKTVETIAEAVVSKPNLTLNEQELDTIFISSGFTSYLERNRTALLEPFKKTIDPNSLNFEVNYPLDSGDFDIFKVNNQTESQDEVCNKTKDENLQSKKEDER